MSSQRYLANGIVAGRVHPEQDPVLLRTLAIARANARKQRRRLRHG